MDNRTLEKIKKCLALAESDNPGEAAAALRQAQKLMAKHNVTSSDLRFSEVGESQAKSHGAQNPPRWVWFLMHTISDVFSVENLNSYVSRYGRTESHAVFIGLGDAPNVAAYAYEVLYRQLATDRRRYLESLPKRLLRKTKTRRADLFAEAWVRAVRCKVEAVAMSDEDKALVKRWKEAEYSEMEKAKHRCHEGLRDGDLPALRAGAEAGSKASIFRGVSAREADAQLETQ
ncbi:DUF2786 domain-containing protein [Modicisalibacter sp. MOD 31.J]|uniref:DUF2786 domain-containing protein n=1 Tax=Modicisalibacter sp. MOD 31.J TaxID=2831897 RepID=UPI001CC93E02|nr:DUF2786 domain-containing protein [Modicisalibacter sp. MOD 31.J]MBZ9574590.1 DUF2786 domain-containing protein [Modicisalibacter sp. MOD 31.J]